ncbi:ABC transporter substrate-binding protein, partial [Micromonospora zhanjiangensis]
MPRGTTPTHRTGAASTGRRGRSPVRLPAALTVVALLLSGGLTGCQESFADPDTDTVQLSVFWWGDQQRADRTEQALRRYSARHPKVGFRVTWQGAGGYYDRLATEATGGNAPDLFQIDDDFLTEYAQRRITLDLTDQVKRRRVDLGGLPPGLARAGEVGGRTVAVAAGEATPALAYDKTVLDGLGVAEPRPGMSYQEFVAWAAEVTRRSGGQVAGASDPAAQQMALWLWLRAQGKEFYTDRQLGFGVPDLTRWFEIWRRARSDRATPSATVTQGANSGMVARQLIATGKAVTSFIRSDQLVELQSYTSDELGVVAYPGNPKAQWPQATMYWAGFRGTRYPDIVADVINFLVNDPEAGRILGTDRGFSPNTSVRAVVARTPVERGGRAAAAYESRMSTLFGPAPQAPPRG